MYRVKVECSDFNEYVCKLSGNRTAYHCHIALLKTYYVENINDFIRLCLVDVIKWRKLVGRFVCMIIKQYLSTQQSKNKVNTSTETNV